MPMLWRQKTIPVISWSIATDNNRIVGDTKDNKRFSVIKVLKGCYVQATKKKRVVKLSFFC